MTTRVPPAKHGHVLTGLKAEPYGWPTASLDPGSGRGPTATSGTPAQHIHQIHVSTVSGDCRYYVQMVERGKDHLGALCVVAANLAERFWTVMNRGMPYVVCDTDGAAVTPEEARKTIAEKWTVPPEVRARRRSKKTAGTKAGKAPQPALTRRDARGDLPQQASSTTPHPGRKRRTA